MSEPLRCVPSTAIVVGYDFSTGGVKALAFDLGGNTVARMKQNTDLWTDYAPWPGNKEYTPPGTLKLYTDTGNRELNLMMLEGQARAATRAVDTALESLTRRGDWLACGVSATHHTAGRIDADFNQVRRAFCWNDQTLATFHAAGLKRLGGQERAEEYTGGPWAVRYSLTHLVKDEQTLKPEDWERTSLILPHGPLAAGYLTGRFDVTSVSSAASTGIMDLRTNKWRREMLKALASEKHQELAWTRLPNIIDMNEPIGPLTGFDAVELNIPLFPSPLVFPTLDDQAAGLIGGGAVAPGQLAIILGNSAVVNSSSDKLPKPVALDKHTRPLDVMKLNWGPYLWMRCYSNGAQFVDDVAGDDWYTFDEDVLKVPAGCGGTSVLPFLLSEPSVGIDDPLVKWCPAEPTDRPVKIRACLEAIAYLIARGVREHENAGQKITRVTVSGGMARSRAMREILASVLDRPLVRLVSDEGPALGAAVVALAGLESHLRKQQGIAEPYTAADAVASMVKFRDPPTQPVAAWVPTYAKGVETFEKWLRGHGPC